MSHISIMSQNLVLCSEQSKIMAKFRRNLSFAEILNVFSKVEIPDCEDPQEFDEKFKNSVKKVLSAKLNASRTGRNE